MFLIVLILSSILNDIQADEKGQEQETIDSPPLKSCAGMTVQTCGIYKPRELEKCKICGLINNDRIHTGPILLAANGTNINPPYLYPWMVALLKRKGKILCGGAIINENYILTAAHCLIKKKYHGRRSLPAKLRGRSETYIRPHELKVGFLTRTDSVTPGSAIEKIIPHPKYHRSDNNYDVALLKLKETITCNMYRNPICLPPANFIAKENTIFNYTGWGETFGDPPQNPKKLLEGQGRLVNFSVCKKFISESLEDTAYCLMGVNSQRACFGDSGGSMFFRRNRTFYTMGVVSMGTYTDCTEDKPFIFSSIPKVVPWITKITGLNPSK